MGTQHHIHPFFNALAQPPRGPLTVADAVALFDKIIKTNELALEHYGDGCAARAHVICNLLLDEGIVPSKAWIFRGRRQMRVMLDGENVKWNYHVAASLPVTMHDGTVQPMVFDPFLFDGPVTSHEWAGVLEHADMSSLQITPLGVRPRNCEGDYTGGSMTTCATTRDARVLLDRYSAVASAWNMKRLTPLPSKHSWALLMGEPA